MRILQNNISRKESTLEGSYGYIVNMRAKLLNSTNRRLNARVECFYTQNCHNMSLSAVKIDNQWLIIRYLLSGKHACPKNTLVLT